MSTPITAHFTIEDFQDASKVRLSPLHVSKAGKLARTLLEPLRRAMNYPIGISSYVRIDSTPHSVTAPGGGGDAVDIYPVGPAKGTPEYRAKVKQMRDWLATYKAGEFGKAIDERDHVHVTLPGYQNAIGEVYDEPTEGTYVLASVFPFVGLTGLPLVLLALFIFWPRGPRRPRRRP